MAMHDSQLGHFFLLVSRFFTHHLLDMLSTFTEGREVNFAFTHKTLISSSSTHNGLGIHDVFQERFTVLLDVSPCIWVLDSAQPILSGFRKLDLVDSNLPAFGVGNHRSWSTQGHGEDLHAEANADNFERIILSLGAELTDIVNQALQPRFWSVGRIGCARCTLNQYR